MRPVTDVARSLAPALCAVLVALTLGACESMEGGLEKLDNTFLKRDPQRLIDDGAQRLTARAAEAHVSGNTELWEEGPVYYHPDGTLEMVWLKIRSGGSWAIDADGEVCLTAPKWKNCHYYLAYDGQVVTVDGGKLNGVLEVQSGKQLRR